MYRFMNSLADTLMTIVIRTILGTWSAEKTLMVDLSKIIISYNQFDLLVF